jgi:2-succinyl-5-enolpyruvyl-6-hydroxy-3-cyclohexene-1-carboxylate synthase
LTSDPALVCREISERLTAIRPPRPVGSEGHAAGSERHPAGDWARAWLDAERVARSRRADLERDRPAADSAVARLFARLVDAAPDGALLFVGNSMAVRDLDAFAPPSRSEARVLANRGAAGIDGCLSAGLGAARAAGSPTIVVLGDVAFAHDVGALSAAREQGLRAKVVVANDGGGGIFDYLAASRLDEALYRRFFVTPPALDIACACAAYGVAHRRTSDPRDLVAAIADGAWSGVEVLELEVDRSANRSFHLAYWAAVAEALSG